MTEEIDTALAILKRTTQVEQEGREFYISLATIHPVGEAKRLMEELATQELGHKQRLEFLYTEVAFPQTNGGQGLMVK
ncbi:hypothetical protein ES703_113435 [subsurface metagenome]